MNLFSDQIRHLIQYVTGRKRDYQHAFLGPPGQRILHDLAKFCRADASTFDPDPRVHAVLEGRREVWLRVQQHLRLSPEQLAELYSGRTLKITKETDDE